MIPTTCQWCGVDFSERRRIPKRKWNGLWQCKGTFACIIRAKSRRAKEAKNAAKDRGIVGWGWPRHDVHGTRAGHRPSESVGAERNQENAGWFQRTDSNHRIRRGGV